MRQRRPLRERALARLRGRNAWTTWLGIILLPAIAGYALYRLLQYDPGEIDVAALVARLGPADIGLSVAAYLVALLLAVLGWGLILGALSGCWRWLDHARIYCMSLIVGRLPGSYWYVLGRVVLYERLGVSRGVTALASGVELAVRSIGGLLVMLVTWPLVLGARSASPLWPLLALLVLGLLLNPPAVRWIVRKLSPHSPAVRYRHVLLWSLIYALVWVLGGVILYLLAAAVVPAITPAALPMLVGVWVTAGMAAMTIFSFLPFGLGAAELTMAALMGGLMPAAEAIFVPFAMRALLTVCELACGLAGLLLGLPALREPAHGTVDQDGGSLSDAEKPEGLFEGRPVVPRKEPGLGGK